eukprot:407506-Prorocentrum_minimum.AAC.1
MARAVARALLLVRVLRIGHARARAERFRPPPLRETLSVTSRRLIAFAAYLPRVPNARTTYARHVRTRILSPLA